MQPDGRRNSRLWFLFAAIVVVVIVVALFTSDNLFHADNAAPGQPSPHALDQTPPATQP